MRGDPHCRWCQGKGCIACLREEAQEEARARAEAEALRPIATFNVSDPREMAWAKKAIGADAVREAFERGGMEEVVRNAKYYGAINEITKLLRRESDS